MRRASPLGFTLLELLVVIAIIGLLAAIVLVSLSFAKSKAQYTRAQEDSRTIETALELYYDTNGDWPAAGNNYFQAYSDQGSWATLGNYLKPYLSTIPVPVYPQTRTGFLQLYTYSKGSVHEELRIPVYDGHTGAFVDCVLIADGYWLDMVLPQQSSLTLDDHGYDPDGIDHAEGNVWASTNPADCPGSATTLIQI